MIELHIDKIWAAVGAAGAGNGDVRGSDGNRSTPRSCFQVVQAGFLQARQEISVMLIDDRLGTHALSL